MGGCCEPSIVAPGCPRCDALLHHRKRGSVRRSWAFLIAAAVLYIPANVLPIMNTSSLLYNQQNTILGGIRVLWLEGSWDLALIVFVASICVPILKIISLCVLLFSTHRQSAWARRGRARLYRLLEFVGQWSMLDIFVVALLGLLVDFHTVAAVRAGPGAVAFGAVDRKRTSLNFSH